jgi:hypothetical protein
MGKGEGGIKVKNARLKGKAGGRYKFKSKIKVIFNSSTNRPLPNQISFNITSHGRS